MNTSEPKIDFAVGGQAVIEGVMMRSPHFYTVSVRDQKGNLASKQSPFNSVVTRYPLLNVPLIRGVVHLIESMSIGFKALDYSNVIFLDEGEKEQKEHTPFTRFILSVLSALYILGTLAFTIFLLKALPLWAAGFVAKHSPFVAEHYLAFNVIDGAVKITLFLSYILAISALKDIRRVFQYHGAEHKSIWTYEKGLPLTVEQARKQTRFHPRCGTSFLVIVILMSVLVYTVVPPVEGFWMMLGQRVVVIPLIAGISFEFLKFSARFQDHSFMKLLIWPGLLVQRLTTREPDDLQLEVALHSLKSALELEQTFVP